MVLLYLSVFVAAPLVTVKLVVRISETAKTTAPGSVTAVEYSCVELLFIVISSLIMVCWTVQDEFLLSTSTVTLLLPPPSV